MLLSFALDCGEGDAAAETFAPNAFIRIDRDGAVTFVMPQLEMGQGTYTSMPMLIAEELEVQLSQVRLEHAPANDKLYGNPDKIIASPLRCALSGSHCGGLAQLLEIC